MTATNEIPSVEEELNRKGLERLGQLIDLLETGKMTHAEFKAGLDSLWWCLSGLVSQDWAEMITQAGEMIDPNDYSFKRNRLFMRDNRLYAVNTTKAIGEHRVNIFSSEIIVKRELNGINDGIRYTSEDTESRVNNFIAQLFSTGFEEL